MLLLVCCQAKSGGEPVVKIQCQVTDVLLVFVSQRPQCQRGKHSFMISNAGNL